jgi:hypothetical protein
LRKWRRKQPETLPGAWCPIARRLRPDGDLHQPFRIDFCQGIEAVFILVEGLNSRHPDMPRPTRKHLDLLAISGRLEILFW